MLELSKLAEKDPEFFRYLQENDRELLDFNMDGNDDDDVSDNADDAVGPEGDRLPSLTEKILRSWQKSLLEVGTTSCGQVFDHLALQTRSLRALRKLLVAFRSAALMNEEDKVLAWSIDSPAGASYADRTFTTELTKCSVRQTREDGLTLHPCRSGVPRPVQIPSKWSIVRPHSECLILSTDASAKQSPHTDAKTKGVAKAHHFLLPQYHPYRFPAL